MNTATQPQPPSPSDLPRVLPSDRALQLEAAPSRDVELAFRRGTLPKLERLVGWEFRGINHPAWAKPLGIKKFVKGFFRDEAGDAYGYNYPVVQNALDEPWLGKPSDHAPKRFGFYRVAPVDPSAKDNAYLHAVLLDYGKGGNKPWDSTGGLRDYLVQVDADNEDLYLGKAYYALGPARIATNFFILERLRRGLSEIVRR